jgi:hypothetical protein
VATPNDTVQIAIEESPIYEGVLTTTTPYRISTNTRFLPVQTLGMNPVPQYLDRSDEVRGIEGSYPNLIETYEPGGSLAIRAYLNDLVYLLATAGLSDTITQGDGSAVKDPDLVAIPAGAWRHVFSKRGGITAKTMQITEVYKDEGLYFKGNGFGLSTLSLNAQGAITGDVMGLYVQKLSSDPNLTPTYDSPSIVNVRRGDLTMNWLTGHGTIDDFTMTITSPLERRRDPGQATYFPNRMEFGDDRVVLSGSIPMSSLSSADVAALIDAQTWSATAKWITPIDIGSTYYNYSMWIQMPAVQYVGGTWDDIANRRRFGSALDWRATWDPVAGYDFKITIVCSVAATETYV